MSVALVIAILCVGPIWTARRLYLALVKHRIFVATEQADEEPVKPSDYPAEYRAQIVFFAIAFSISVTGLVWIGWPLIRHQFSN